MRHSLHQICPISICRIITLSLFFAITLASLTACAPILELNQKYARTHILVNYGDKVSTDIGQYINLDVLSEEDRDFVKNNSSIEYTGKKVPGKAYDKLGNYTLTIYYNGQVYRKYDVTVRDTEAPKFKKVKDVYVFKGLDYSAEEVNELVKSMFRVTDNSDKVKVKYSHSTISTDKARDYIVHAKATDKSGNQSEARATFHVQKAEYGAKGTYVYVSIPKQTLTYFVDGNVDMSTPIVSGTAGIHDTPWGTYSINSMSMGTRLKGQDYDVKVNYWMAFIGGAFGLHSAEWRGAFGGNIYQYGGSHGCVNMPVYAAGELYGKVNIGTPVIIGK